MDEELLIILEKILSKGEVDNIRIRLDGWNYQYLSKEEPADSVLHWEVLKEKISENWWRWTY